MRFGIDMRVPHVVILRVVEQVVDQRVAVALLTVPSVNTKRSKPVSTVWLDGPSMITLLPS